MSVVIIPALAKLRQENMFEVPHRYTERPYGKIYKLAKAFQEI